MAKTLITFLIDGTYSGIKILDMPGKSIKCFVVPRKKLSEFAEVEGASHTGLYFLFGSNENADEIVYIGQTDNLAKRWKDHVMKKDYRDVAIGFVYDNNTLDLGDVTYLEYKTILKAKEAKRYQLMNKTEPTYKKLSLHKESVLNDFIEDIDLLISSVGYPILKTPDVDTKQLKIYHCTGPSASGKGIYSAEGVVVLAGSKGRKDIPKASIPYVQNQQTKLFDLGVIKMIDDQSFEFTQNYTFKSPSGASNIILGRNSNGYNERYDDNNKTLNENERQDKF